MINLIKLLAETHLKLDLEIASQMDSKNSKLVFNFNHTHKNK